MTFVETGSEDGKRTASRARARAGCPAFGQMLSAEQIQAIVEYERSL